MTEGSLEERLLAAAGRRRKPVTRAALLRAARVGRREQEAAAARLTALEADGRLLRLPGDRWAPPSDFELFLFGAQQAATRTTLKPADRALISADPAKTGVEGPHGHVLY